MFYEYSCTVPPLYREMAELPIKKNCLTSHYI